MPVFLSVVGDDGFVANCSDKFVWSGLECSVLQSGEFGMKNILSYWRFTHATRHIPNSCVAEWCLLKSREFGMLYFVT